MPTCFSFNHPQVSCALYDDSHGASYAFRRCIIYILDQTKPKKLPFFDLPYHKNDGVKIANRIEAHHYIDDHNDKFYFSLDEF